MKTLIPLALILLSIPAAMGAPPNWGHYPDRPLQLQDLVPPDGRHFSLIRDFRYVDPTGVPWVAPKDLITDGATIPMPFWSVIGGPFEALYREAAVIHDAGCCAQTKPWKDVDLMFYRAMRCSGVGWAKANTMYFAVLVGGPHWKKLNATMPADCKIRARHGFALDTKTWKPLVSDRAADALWQTIETRELSPTETIAVARPFFPNGNMTDARAKTFVANLKKKGATPDERRVITLSVIQSQRFSEQYVASIEKWIKEAKPTLAQIELRAAHDQQGANGTFTVFPNILKRPR